MEGPLLTKNEHIVDVTADDNSPPLLDYQPRHDDGEQSDLYITERFWNAMEFVSTLVQIVVAIVVLIQPRDEEHLQILLFIWIIGYICGCIASLPILCWRFWYYNPSFSSGTEEYSRWKRVNEKMDTLKSDLKYFFVAWFVVFIWNLMINTSFLDDTTTPFLWLVAALLAFIFLRYVVFNFQVSVLCFLSPMLLCYIVFVYGLILIATPIYGFFSCICGCE